MVYIYIIGCYVLNSFYTSKALGLLRIKIKAVLGYKKLLFILVILCQCIMYSCIFYASCFLFLSFCLCSMLNT